MTIVSVGNLTLRSRCLHQFSTCFRLIGDSSRRWASSSKSRTPDDIEHEEDKPVVYSTSKAAQWKAQHSFRPMIKHEPPAVQRYSVILSTAAFLIYFCILREENDLDEILDRPLSATVPDIEKLVIKPPQPPEDKKFGFF